MTAPLGWLSLLAGQRGLRYEPDVDERWLRVWEPFTTLKVPIRYEHAISSTGAIGSITIARMVITFQAQNPVAQGAAFIEREASCFIGIVQDERLAGKMAVTSDRSLLFGESLDLVSMTRRISGDVTFDTAFASFAPTADDLNDSLTPSLRKLLLSWRIPVHAEVRQGGFIVAPVALAFEPQGLSWLLDAVHVFGEKAAKKLRSNTRS